MYVDHLCYWFMKLLERGFMVLSVVALLFMFRDEVLLLENECLFCCA